MGIKAGTVTNWDQEKDVYLLMALEDGGSQAARLVCERKIWTLRATLALMLAATVRESRLR